MQKRNPIFSLKITKCEDYLVKKDLLASLYLFSVKGNDGKKVEGKVPCAEFTVTNFSKISSKNNKVLSFSNFWALSKHLNFSSVFFLPHWIKLFQSY